MSKIVFLELRRKKTVYPEAGSAYQGDEAHAARDRPPGPPPVRIPGSEAARQVPHPTWLLRVWTHRVPSALVLATAVIAVIG